MYISLIYGQKLVLRKNNTKIERCPVRAALCIRARAQRYNIPIHHPIAIFKNHVGGVTLITSRHVENFLQKLAKSVYNITKTEELKRFSSHSIRVGACVLLHENNCTCKFIKVQLRWRSDAVFNVFKEHNKISLAA